jgi:hypothetical protein
MSSSAVSRDKSISNLSKLVVEGGGTGVDTRVEDEDIDGAAECIELRVAVVAVEAIEANTNGQKPENT